MAGYYADVPAHRFALDVDGTVFRRIDAGKTTVSDASTAKTTILDTDSDSYSWTSWGSWAGGQGQHLGYLAVVFPELRDLTAYFICISGGGAVARDLEYSTNTTDGLDGTWTQVTANWTNNGIVTPNYRTNIITQSLAGIKALRFGFGKNDTGGGGGSVDIQCLHLYGNIAGGQNPDRLRFWHPTLDQEVGGAHFDFGDVPVGSQSVKQFRIKNNSTTLTANNISLSKSSASFAEVDTGITFSSDGSVYTTTLSAGNLSPTSISSVLYVKRTVASGEATSVPKDGRITASASTWT